MNLADFLARAPQARRAVVLHFLGPFQDPLYHRIALDVAAEFRNLFSDVRLIVVSGRSKAAPNILNTCVRFPRIARDEAAGLGVRLDRLQRSDLDVRGTETFGDLFGAAVGQLRAMRGPDELTRLDLLAPGLGSSVFSSLSTSVLRASVTTPKSWRKYAERQILNFFEGYIAIDRVFGHEPNMAAIPNGRFPDQRGAALRAAELGLNCVFYEKGGTRERFHMETFAPNSTKMQHLAFSNVDSSNRELAALGTKAIMQKFGEPLEGVIRPRKVSIDLVSANICYFASSLDEYVGLGEEWNPPFWDDQWSALQHLRAIVGPGNRVTIRMHPNSLQKTWRELVNLHQLASSLGWKVVPSWSATDSYLLARHSDIVMTWGSTMGLEAAAFGIPVMALGPSFYAESGCTLTADDLWAGGSACSGWTDPHRAQVLLGFLSNHGQSTSLSPRAQRSLLRASDRARNLERLLLAFAFPIQVFKRPGFLLRLLRLVLGDVHGRRVFGASVGVVARAMKARTRE